MGGLGLRRLEAGAKYSLEQERILPPRVAEMRSNMLGMDICECRKVGSGSEGLHSHD